MIFEVFVAVKVWNVLAWVLTPCSLVSGYNIKEEHIASIFGIDSFIEATPRRNPEDHSRRVYFVVLWYLYFEFKHGVSCNCAQSTCG